MDESSKRVKKPKKLKIGFDEQEIVSDYIQKTEGIMTSFLLITNITIRKYKRKLDKKLLLEGLIQACLDLKSRI